MNKTWPKDGVVLVLCKGGKYWADLVSPDLENAKDVLDDLKRQAKEQQNKELREICARRVSGKGLTVTH